MSLDKSRQQNSHILQKKIKTKNSLIYLVSIRNKLRVLEYMGCSMGTQPKKTQSIQIFFVFIWFCRARFADHFNIKQN
jgi:hypothetical protein